jgi:Plant mobile domain
MFIYHCALYLQIEWQPYKRAEVTDLQFDPWVLEHSRYWRARLPLICFYIVELHMVHRVQRQFGKLQPLQPEVVSTQVKLHK